ncbi:MAG: hypothetical protein HKP26_06460 [Nitrosopumilus sp.]|nr:hypothetical protein [Nitrosopumilus sp.]
MKIMRTKVENKSKWSVISNCSVRSVLKISLVGVIALFVLTVSIPSAFAQSTESETDSPIKMILDMTLENLEESILDPDREIPTTAQTFYQMGQGEYQLAIDALNDGDIQAAEEHALVAMALFEDSASVIGELEESLVLGQLPPGFGSGVRSGSETGTTQGQGLGVGGIPPGIMKQLSAANVFEIQEQITEIDEEINGLRQLAESNGIDVNLQDYDESINLAKEVLANGDIPNAQAKLALANEIKGDIINQMNIAAEESQDERVREFVDNSIASIEEMLEKGENLGLTKKAIDELEETLEILKTGEIDDILDKTSDNSELAKELKEENKEAEKELKEENKEAEQTQREENKEAEQTQREENKEAEKELKSTDPDAAKELKDQNKEAEKLLKEENKEAEKELKDQNKEAEKLLKEENKESEKELKVSKFGKIPPGLAKFLDKSNDESESSTENNIGSSTESSNSEDTVSILSDVYDVSGDIVYSPDDYFEDAVDELEEDSFEENYDKMYKDSKAKVKKDKAKQAKLDRIAEAAANGGPPGLAKKVNDGITDGDSGNTSMSTNGLLYTVQGFTAIKNGKDVTSNIKIDVTMATGSGLSDINNGNQPVLFTPDVNGTYTIIASVGGLSDVTRILQVGDPSAPSQVTNLSATRDNQDPIIVLTWDTPANGGSPITGYFIEIESPVGGGWGTEIANTGNSTTTYTDIGLIPDTEYNYRVSAINAIGTGPASDPDSAKTKK